MKLKKIIKHLEINVPVTIVIETGEIVYEGAFEGIPWRFLDWQLNPGMTPAIEVENGNVYIYMIEGKRYVYF